MTTKNQSTKSRSMLGSILPYLSGIIAVFRLLVMTFVLYGLLTVVASWAVRNIQSKEQVEATPFEKVTEFQKLDRFYWDAFVSVSLCAPDQSDCTSKKSDSDNSDEMVLDDIESFKSINVALEERYQSMMTTQTEVFPVEIKSSDDSREAVQQEKVYTYAILTFKRGLTLLWTSGLVLLIVMACMSVIRNTEEQYETLGYYLKYVGGVILVGLAVVTLLPKVYFSSYLRPGQEFLPLGFQMDDGIGPTVMFVFDILFVISFAGIVSQFGLEQLLKKTPEENMIHFRDGFPVAKVFALGMARSAERLTSMIPFLLTATLFANARVDKDEGINKLFEYVFRVSQDPGPALQALLITTVVVLSLNTLGKRLMITIQEVLYTIPASKEIR